MSGSAAEQAILQLIENRQEYADMADLIGLPQSVMLAIATHPPGS
jgi:hypothetical protein